MLNFATVLLGLLLMAAGTTSRSVSGPHIADVNILLPPKMTHPVEYRLQGSDGCFKWSWDHHDILSVLPEYNVSRQCSTSARLISIAPYSGRKETAVYAADIQTGSVIRCKVYIDKFSRIQIFHNSVKLDLDGLATLRVRAFDTEENVFSSLVGLQFMWRLMPQIGGSPHHLAHVPLKDSPLSDCGGLCGDLDIQIKLEDSGVFSDLFVIRGIEIGQEIVSLHLLEPELKHMADKIILTVAEAMSLDPPSPVFVLVGATVRYNLKVIRANIPQAVTLPSPHYQWSTSNSSVALIDSDFGLTKALSLGVTTVVVEDTRVAGHIQISSLNVVKPESLHLYITPLSIADELVEGIETTTSVAHWYIVSGRQYLIQVKVFSRGPTAQEIYITESDNVKLHDNETEYLRTYFVPNDLVPKHKLQTSRILQATSKGRGKLTTSLTYYGSHYESKEVLKIAQEVVICEQVRFCLDNKSGASRSILLPWIPSVHQEVFLKATGGCADTSSDYKWFSSDTSVVSVSAFGVVQARKSGKATVKVLSNFDSSNYDEVVIEVALPASMMMIHSFPVETDVGSYLQAAVSMQSSNGVYFYRCDAFNLHVKWKTGSEFFKIENTTRDMPVLDKLENVELHGSFFGPPCSWTSVYASGYGHTMLQATLYNEYQHLDFSLSGPIIFKASSRIAAYPPLLVRHAGDGSQFGGYWVDLAPVDANSLGTPDMLYLAPGTHYNVMLHGGPEQWDDDVQFIDTVEILGEKSDFGQGGILVHQLPENYRGSYQILCQTLGTFKLHFKRGNLVGDDHPLPAIAEVLLPVMCRIPSSIVLITDEPANEIEVIRAAVQADRGLQRIRTTPLTLANGRTIRVAAVGISDSREPFANSSSLCLRWELNGCGSLAFWDELYGLEKSKCGWERFLNLQNESGECIVRATVTGFSDVVEDDNSVQLVESSDNILTDAIRLQLVSTLRVNPEYSLLFFNPDLKVKMLITGGSCSLEAVANDSRIVEVLQPASGIQCRELVLLPKGLGTALVTVYDIGVNPPQTASAVVRVADIDWIKISSQDEISLMEESSQVVDLAAGINDGSTFDFSQFAFMHILVHIEDPIVELLDTDSLSSHGIVRAPSFRIRAVALGITTLYVSLLQQSGREILSEPIKIEVYAPPRVHPHVFFLLPGASYTITVKGGPTVGTYVEYASMDNTIVNIDKSSGKLSAVSSGKCNISATFYHHGGSVVCQAYGKIKVGVPSTVVLNVQDEQLGVGNEMPIYALFPEGNVFSFYELCKGYHWTVEDENVLSFSLLEHFNSRKYRSASAASEDVQFMSYMNEPEELGFFNKVYGRSAGMTNIAVSFSCEFTSGSSIQTKFYNASASLLVVPNLPLALGIAATWNFPPYYTTSRVLPSSMDSHSHWDGQSWKRAIVYSLLRSCGEKSEDVLKDAISIQGDRIKTSESNNLACIQAKDRFSGRMEIAACVRVVEVAQIRLANQEFPFHVINLAVGTELSLPISYYDSLGNLFHEAHGVVLFYVETNYPDIVSINYSREGDGYIYLKAKQHGRALVQVSIDKSPEKSDYILISVGASIHPQDPVVHVGSHLKLSVKGLNDQISGRWIATNESVLSVDMLSGIAEAVGPGSTEVLFEGPNLNLQTTVIVQPGYIVSVAAPAELLTNVPYPVKGYNFSVKFSSSYGTPLNDMRILHDCTVDPPFVGYAKPWLDLEHNNSYCFFFPYSPEHLAHSVPKSKATRPDIFVLIHASSREASQISGSASALFVGGFSVMEMGQSLKQLNLTPDSNRTVITILGNTDVEVHWHERNLVISGPISGVGGSTEYEVKAIGERGFKDKIVITLAANGQRTEIDVSYDPRRRRSLEDLLPFLSACLFAIIVGVGTYIYIMDNRLTAAPLAQSAVTGPDTPTHTSPAILNEQSPRTPQPFIDYVRRTIDETPNYRRGGRRRFNVQNSL